VTREEAVKLCAYVEAACPAQQMADFTPDVWCEILPASYTLDECRAAVAAIIRRGERYADLGTIITEVRRVRAAEAEREHLAVLLDPAAYRDMLAADDAEFMRKLAARTGGARLKAIPPPDYDDPAERRRQQAGLARWARDHPEGAS
jgi:hypothetical protein